MELKKHTSISEQINILTSRGLIINDKSYAEEVLSSVNYYRFSGYLHNFKKPDSDRYVDGLTFEKIKRLYDFDKMFTHILMYALEDIEETFKTRLSYTVTSSYPDDPLIYLKPTIYREYLPYTLFLKYFYTEKDNNSGLPFIKHHDEKYDSFLPMWVAVEIFTMGNLKSVYENLISKHQKALARKYNTGPRQLENWLKNLTYTRNHLAHYTRVYNYNFGRTPVSCKNHLKPVPPTNMIFDQIFVIASMYSDKEEWNNYILSEFEAIFLKYEADISLSSLGFPLNWREILTQ